MYNTICFIDILMPMVHVKIIHLFVVQYVIDYSFSLVFLKGLNLLPSKRMGQYFKDIILTGLQHLYQLLFLKCLYYKEKMYIYG